MFRQRIKHYHQWLRSAIHLTTTNGYVLPFISNFVRTPLIRSGYKALHKEQALASCIRSPLSKNAIDRVENVKSLRFYSRLFLVPKPHQRWRPVIDLSRLKTLLLVERFKMETPESIRASDARGMGVVDRFIRLLPSHPHPPKLKEVPTALPQVTGVPVHLPPFRTGHSPTGLYNDCKGSEADGSHKGNQASPVPGRLADHGPVSERRPSEHSDSGRPESVLRVDNKPGEF